MPFPTATLTSTQYNKLRGTSSVNPTWYGRVYASLCPNTVAVQCRVNGAPTGTSFAGFAYDGVTVGLISNVMVGMTVIISRDSNIRNGFFVGRVRELPTGTTAGSFFLNETSAPVEDNDYIFVIYDWRLWPVLGRDVVGFQIVDWDNTYVALPPAIVGLSDVYAGWVSSATGKLRLSFDISDTFATTSGATISTIIWTLPASGTLVSGTLADAAITVDFDDADGVWVHVSVLDNAARTITRHFQVFAHSDDYPPVMSIDALSLNCDLKNGWSGDLTAFDEFDDVLDNTSICLWIDEAYNGTSGSLFSDTNIPNNIVFVGRLRSERNPIKSDEKHGLIADVSFTLEGLGAQLARMYGALIAEINESAPTLFDQIKDLTIWRGIWHLLAFYTTFPTLHDIVFDDTSNDFLCQGLRTQGGNLLDLINDLAQSINAQIEFAASGETRILRDPRYLTTDERNGLLTLANFTTSDGTECSLEVEHVKTIGRGDSSGGMYFNLGAINTVFPVLSIAPGMAQDYPDGTVQLTRQVLTANQAVSQAQDELDIRGGRQFAIANSSTKLTWQFCDSYWWITPSLGYWFTFTLGTDTNVRGRSFSTSNRWLMQSITLTYDPADCTFQPPECLFILDINEDTDGAEGDDVTYPDPGDTLPLIPPMPIFEPYPGIITPILPLEPPPFPDPTPIPIIAKNGNTVVIWSSTQVWTCLNFYSPTRVWNEITPEGGATIRQCLFDPYPDAKGLWILANDGTDSFVYYTDNFVTPVYTQGASVSGLFTEIRATQEAGGILLYSPAADGSTWEEVFDFTSSNGGWAAQDVGGTYVAATGWSYVDALAGSQYYRGVEIGKSLSSSTVTYVEMTYNYTKGTSDVPTSIVTDIEINGSALATLTFNDESDGTGKTFSYGSTVPSVTSIAVTARSSVNTTATYSGSVLITQVRVRGNGVNPFGGGGDATVVYSTDHGASWGTAINAGSSPGAIGGFDVIRIGTVTLAGSDAQGQKATTLGGAYTTLGSDGATVASDPVLLELPWGQFAAASTNNWSTSTPDYILGSAALVSGHCLWAVDGGGGRTGITPSGVTSIISNNCLTTYFGTRAALIASVSGTRHVFTTTNLSTSPTWVDRATAGANADFIRPLRLSPTLGHLFWVDGTNAKYSLDYAVTINTAGTPCTGTLLGIEVYG